MDTARDIVTIISIIVCALQIVVLLGWRRWLTLSTANEQYAATARVADAGSVERLQKSLGYKAESATVDGLKDDVRNLEEEMKLLSGGFNRFSGETAATLKLLVEGQTRAHAEITELRALVLSRTKH